MTGPPKSCGLKSHQCNMNTVAQLVEHSAISGVVVGSSPTILHKIFNKA